MVRGVGSRLAGGTRPVPPGTVCSITPRRWMGNGRVLSEPSVAIAPDVSNRLFIDLGYSALKSTSSDGLMDASGMVVSGGGRQYVATDRVMIVATTPAPRYSSQR